MSDMKKISLLKRIAIALFCTIMLLAVNSNDAFAIIGGERATDGEETWMVGVVLADVQNGYYAQFCGGTLIDAHWVLTAAHCTYNEQGQLFSANELEIVVNRNRLSSHSGERIAVKQIIRHPGFDGYTYNIDLALLELAEPSTGTPVQITNAEMADGQTAYVYGWGVSDRGRAVDGLRKVEMPIVNRQDCDVAYEAYDRSVNTNMLCVGYATGGKDACTGDSGGPLIVQNYWTGEWTQHGIVSWGEGCAEAGAYGVYTNLARFKSWIDFQVTFYNSYHL